HGSDRSGWCGQLDRDLGPVGAEEVLAVLVVAAAVDLHEPAPPVEDEQLVIDRDATLAIAQELLDDDPTRHIDIRPFPVTPAAVEASEPRRAEPLELIR